VPQASSIVLERNLRGGRKKCRRGRNAVDGDAVGDAVVNALDAQDAANAANAVNTVVTSAPTALTKTCRKRVAATRVSKP